MTIIPLEELSAPQRETAAAILVSALAHCPSTWHDMTAARNELAKFFERDDRLGFAGLDGDRPAGWIGAIRHSDHAWELHPLVVDPALQRRGFGTRLVQALESAASSSGACTIWLGTDDEFGGTNLFGLDLYPDVLGELAGIAPTTGHPFTFYRQLGYAVVGVLPDADGPGKHDILMAKRIGAGGT